MKAWHVSIAALAALTTTALAQEPFKIGLVAPLTGPFTSTGKQVVAGAQLYLQQNGPTVAGRRIELIVKDDGAVADQTRRLVQELIVNDKVNAVAGFGLTPLALAAAPLATQAKVPMIVMAAATSIITERSPYIVRTSFAQAQPVVVIADWEAKNGVKKAVSLVSDFAPGYDSEAFFKNSFTRAGGQVVESLRIPLQNPDFAPFLQRARDAGPEGMFVFVPAGQAAALARQFVERGLDKSGIKLFGAGDITDDDILNNMGDVMLGTVTAYFYSAAHPSEKNRAFVDGIRKANNGMRANFFGVSGYDGMHALYEALKRTNGAGDGDALVGAMKGLQWESPRGPISIDAETRDIIQNIYIRRVEKRDGELWNMEFATVENVKDPVKAAKK
ncbi:MAG: ABC transporter substrate-binding protein [Hyphomicrobiales bacterium]|nr:ABC transporter substrate-binding protein [Hyphomicrobiales bacterium]